MRLAGRGLYTRDVARVFFYVNSIRRVTNENRLNSELLAVLNITVLRMTNCQCRMRT